MTFLPKLIYWEALLFLVGLLTVVGGRLISGGINTSNLLHGRNANGTLYLSPERVQLLLLTLATAFQYMSAFLHNPTIFPEVSGTWLTVLGSSHLVYLGGKIAAAFFNRPNG